MAITSKHVRQAQHKIEIDRITEVVRTLPNQSKLVLFSILLIERQNKKAGVTQIMTTGEVFDVYRELCKKVRYDCLTQRRITDLISELDMLGIITARVISKGRYGRTREIGVPSSSNNLMQILQEDDMFEELANYKMKSQTRLI
jgi:cell division control protein 6